MGSLTYVDFELQVQRAGDRYKADVLRSPVGEASSLFELPFSEDRLENLILKIGPHSGHVRGQSSGALEAAIELGGRLFDGVFSGDVRTCLRRSLDAVAGQPGLGLRLKLRLQAIAELGDLPWEFLYDGSEGCFLAQSSYTPLVRYLEMAHGIQPLTVELPLRVLILISAPDDPQYVRLDVDRERQRVQEAVGPLLHDGRVDVDWLEEATLAELRRALHANTYHVFHFVGHGGFDASAGSGLLVFEDERRRAVRVGPHRIGPLLQDHRTLRLCVLNACEGARSSRADPFSGIATNLVRRGIPAVVAMQFEISDGAAVTFAHGFYAALASGYPVDMAVTEARGAILAQPNDVEWATPVLYMRSPDGLLFDVKESPRQRDGSAVGTHQPIAGLVRRRDAVLFSLKAVPGDLLSLLYEPRRFLGKRGSEGDLVPPFVFLLFSQFLAVVVVLGSWPSRTPMLQWMIGQPALVLIGACVISLPLYLAWRLVGSPGEYRRLFVILLYQCSVVALGCAALAAITVAAVGFTMGMSALEELAAHGTRAALAALGEQLDAAAGTTLLVITMVNTLIVAGLLAWLLMTWRAYRQALEMSRLRAGIALGLFVSFCVLPVLLLVWIVRLLSS